jgi:hypothetical protein
VKASEAEFHFPVLGFTPDREIWAFADLNTLTSCGPRTLKDNMQSGMELVDADGRRWVVRSVRRIGRAESLLVWVLAHAFSTPQSRIEHELEEMTSISLDEVKARVRFSMETHPQDFYEADEAAFLEAVESVRVAQSVAEIHDLLGLDSFMAY